MSSNADHINYAKHTGYNSVAASVVYAVVYLPLFAWFIRQSFVIPTHVHYILTLFCSSEQEFFFFFELEGHRTDDITLVRIVAFVLRSFLAGSETAGENLSLLITDQILFGVGFFALLYSAYTLVLDL